MEKIKVMIIGNNDNRIYEIKSLLGNEEIAFVGFSKQGDSALEKTLSLKPQVVIIHCEEEVEDAVNLAEKLNIKMPGSGVIFLCDHLSVAIIDKAMFAGVRKVMSFPVDAKSLIQNIQLVNQVEKSRSENSSTAVANMESKVVTVFGAKGGIGKTTIAVNVGVVLAKMGKKVAILDANLQFGDVNVFFDIDSKDTISELSQGKDLTDIDAIKRLMALHYTGVSILCAPKSPEYAEYVSAKNVETIINTMRPYYDYIIIDTTPAFSDVNVVAIENSNLILLICEPDISTIRNTKVSLNILEYLQQRDKTEIVINRAGNGTISIKDIQKVLDVQIKHKIPLDIKIGIACHNKGVPIVVDSPRTAIAQELRKLGKEIVNTIDQIGK
ncbi:AAA family ATPase [Acetobacterium sp.]|uniref:AAA family ATPase n=1 Tax=Acetobacterium sp. TaxID=1872094 RepID=UPI002F4151FC